MPGPEGPRRLTPERSELAGRNMALALALAARFRPWVPEPWRGEMEGEALLALTLAAGDYDPARGEWPPFAAYRIANHLIDRGRVHRRRARLLRRVALAASLPDPAAARAASASAARIDAATVLAGLTPRQAAAVRLVYGDGRPTREAAPALGVARSTLRLDLAAALAALRPDPRTPEPRP